MATMSLSFEPLGIDCKPSIVDWCMSIVSVNNRVLFDQCNDGIPHVSFQAVGRCRNAVLVAADVH